MQSIEFSKSGNVVYNIDTDKRTVTAKIKCSNNEAWNLFNSQLTKHIMGTGMAIVGDQWSFDYCYGYSNAIMMNDEYVGKAKCHPDDEFDIEYGKMLALLRAKEKYLNAMCKRMDSIYDWINALRYRVMKTDYKLTGELSNCCNDLYNIEVHHGH